MSWLIPRMLAGAVAIVPGFWVGHLVGSALEAPSLGALFGSMIGVILVSLFDTLKAYRLIRWLSGSQDQAAPSDAGFWGEIGYRVERALRIRERQAVQEKIRLSQFVSAMEASPNGVLLLDASDHIHWCNSVAAAHFGLDPARDRLQPVTNLIRAPDFVSYLQGGRFDEAVLVRDLLRGRGTLSVVIRVYGEGLKLVLSHDVTERERSDAMRRDFVANVSHEIRTPLTVVSGYIETMAHLTLSESERHQALTLMGQQTRRMQTLVEDLLTLAQLEGSPRPPSDRWVDVDKLLARAQSDAALLSQGHHHFELLTAGGVQLAGTESELLSAVTNLVNNAVRYTPQGGFIVLGWRRREGGGGEISVSDTGIGVAKEHIVRLTERFYRVDSSRSRDTGGTGLGLSIVKHVIQRHGGELDIQSTEGRGSRFCLVFPASRVRDQTP